VGHYLSPLPPTVVPEVRMSSATRSVRSRVALLGAAALLCVASLAGCSSGSSNTADSCQKLVDDVVGFYQQYQQMAQQAGTDPAKAQDAQTFSTEKTQEVDQRRQDLNCNEADLQQQVQQKLQDLGVNPNEQPAATGN
jgi:hypothetical protein